MAHRSDFDSAWKDALVLIHVEIQVGRDAGFAQRMFAYHVRLREKHPRRSMVGLPEALELDFDDAVLQIEKETQMTYVTSIERVRLKREREQGL